MDGDDVTIGIVNPDGSRAEMSGNGTRIAAAWHMSRTGSARARVHVGPRTVEVHRTEDGLYESDLGPVEVETAEVVDGLELTPVSVGNPHAVVIGDPEVLGLVDAVVLGELFEHGLEFTPKPGRWQARRRRTAPDRP